jgi:AcrR family transcriptional regulator
MQKGYGETSMDAIAQASGVSKATLYAHFDGKDELFAQLITTECRSLADRIGLRPLGNSDIRTALMEIAENFNNLLCTGEGLTMYRIVVAEVPRFPELGRIFYECGPREMLDGIAEFMREAAERGLLDIPSPRIAAIQFVSLIRGETHLTRILGLGTEGRSLSEYTRRSVALFLAGYGSKEQARHPAASKRAAVRSSRSARTSRPR